MVVATGYTSLAAGCCYLRACEGQPVTIMEAMAAKLPILTTFAADDSDIVTPDIGWKVEAANHDAMAAKIAEVIQSEPKILAQMGKRGYEKVSTNFTWDMIADKTVDCYKAAGLWK